MHELKLSRCASAVKLRESVGGLIDRSKGDCEVATNRKRLASDRPNAASGFACSASDSGRVATVGAPFVTMMACSYCAERLSGWPTRVQPSSVSVTHVLLVERNGSMPMP